MKTTIQRFISVAVRMSTDRGMHRRFAYILLFSSLAVCPAITRGGCVEDTDGEIPFTVTLLHPQFIPGHGGSCFYVEQGPIVRQSTNVSQYDLVPGQTCTFYRIKKSIFPHTGLW